MLASPDPQVSDRAAAQWCTWEDTHVSLMPDWEPFLSVQDRQFQQVFARLVTHYWSNGCFLTEGQLAANLPLIADVRAVLIHGRYDVSSPLDTAWDLHRAWPASRLVILDGSGHGGADLNAALVQALDEFRQLR